MPRLAVHWIAKLFPSGSSLIPKHFVTNIILSIVVQVWSASFPSQPLFPISTILMPCSNSKKKEKQQRQNQERQQAHHFVQEYFPQITMDIQNILECPHSVIFSWLKSLFNNGNEPCVLFFKHHFFNFCFFQTKKLMIISAGPQTHTAA